MKKLGILHISDVHINAFSISEIDLLVDKLTYCATSNRLCENL